MITELHGLGVFVGSNFASLKATERGEDYDMTVHPDELAAWQARGEEFVCWKLWRVHQRNERLAAIFMGMGGFAGASARVAQRQAVNAIEVKD